MASILTINQGPDTIPTHLNLPHSIGKETEAFIDYFKLKQQKQDSKSDSLATCSCS